MNKKIQLVACAMLFITSFFTSAATVQYKHISKLIDEYNDYPTYNVEGVDYPSFKVLSDSPLHIQISPRTMAGYGLKYDSEKAAVYATYRTLYQTPAQSVTVTVLPLLINTKTRSMEYLPSDQFEFSITKTQAANLLLKYGNIHNIEQLMTSSGAWSEQFDKCCYRDNSGLSTFTQALIAQQ